MKGPCPLEGPIFKIMQQLSADQIKKLKAPLPAAAVSKHPTKTYLSSIKAIYVVERLNDVFGIGSWKLKSEVIDNKTDMIVVRATLTIPEYGIELESFGGNDNGGENSKNFDLGDAYKGATTDALTKICSYLEIGIDVFKGPQGKSQDATDDKPWLNQNSKEFVGAITKLNAGTTTIAAIEKHFKLSGKIRKFLESAAEKQTA